MWRLSFLVWITTNLTLLIGLILAAIIIEPGAIEVAFIVFIAGMVVSLPVVIPLYFLFYLIKFLQPPPSEAWWIYIIGVAICTAAVISIFSFFFLGDIYWWLDEIIFIFLIPLAAANIASAFTYKQLNLFFKTFSADNNL